MEDSDVEQRQRLAGAGESRRGLVAAVADINGRPAGLKITQDALRLSAEDLSAEVLSAVQAAHDAAMEAVGREIRDLPDRSGHTADQIEETVLNIQADVRRQTARAMEELDEVRQRLGRLIG